MAAKRNITLALDPGLLKKARALAAQKGHSVSSMIANHLRKLVNENDEYESAKRRALALMEEGLPLGGKPMSRDELHDRDRLRRQ
jgi:hypothetical protein